MGIIRSHLTSDASSNTAGMDGQRLLKFTGLCQLSVQASTDLVSARTLFRNQIMQSG
jgi:hypothetical protein